MGAVQSAAGAMQRTGLIEGHETDFIYHVLAETGEKMLSWASESDSKSVDSFVLFVSLVSFSLPYQHHLPCRHLCSSNALCTKVTYPEWCVRGGSSLGPLGRDNKWTNIRASQMIAVLPVHADLPHDYAIHFVKKGSEKESEAGSSASLPVFESIMATRLPSQFIEDFSPSGLSCFSARSGRDADNTNMHVVVSTRSGTGLADRFYQSAVKTMWTRLGLQETDYAVHYTQSEEHVTELTKSIFLSRANEGVDQAIILMSGDGGVVDIVNALSHGKRTSKYTRPSIALLPFGTGNALAHSLKISEDETMGLANMVQGHHQPMPLFRVSFSPGARLLVNEGRDEQVLPMNRDHPVVWGAVVCSWGFHAGLVADSDTTEYRKFGAERFQMAAKAALFPDDGSLPHAYEGEVSVQRGSTPEWEKIERQKHAYVLATMVSNLEKGFVISPDSKPLDGKLRLVHFGALSGDRIMEIMTAAYQGGKHVNDTDVRYEEIEGLKISFDGNDEDGNWRRICVDGKIIKIEKDGWVEVKKEHQQVVDIVCRTQEARGIAGVS